MKRSLAIYLFHFLLVPVTAILHIEEAYAQTAVNQSTFIRTQACIGMKSTIEASFFDKAIANKKPWAIEYRKRYNSDCFSYPIDSGVCNTMRSNMAASWFKPALARGDSNAIKLQHRYEDNCFKFYASSNACDDIRTTVEKSWFKPDITSWAAKLQERYDNECFSYYTRSSDCEEIKSRLRKDWFYDDLNIGKPYAIKQYDTYKNHCQRPMSDYGLSLAPSNPTPTTNETACSKWTPGNYIRVMEDQDRNKSALRHIQDYISRLRAAGALDLFQGFVVNFYWGAIESSKGNDNFSLIDNILKELDSHPDTSHMKIFLMTQKVTFFNGCNSSYAPNYLPEEHATKASSKKCFIKYWEPNVADRFIEFNNRLLSKYEREPRVLGAFLSGESAIDVPSAKQNPRFYNDVLNVYADTARSLGNRFPSMIFTYGMNWPNERSYFEKMAGFMEAIPAGSLTWPDSVPPPSAYTNTSDMIPTTLRTKRAHYNVASAKSNNLAIIAGVQNPQVASTQAESDRIYNFLSQKVKAQIIVWEGAYHPNKTYSANHLYPGTSGRNYLEKSVIPTVKAHAGRLANESCPFE